ncbi:MAG: pyridoxal 4-dehydrogenase [Alphaproteobacteria bacterium]|nr:MAG: pyridoxal 4-dehydrogenase [Alphaproteobacteria bacterium]
MQRSQLGKTDLTVTTLGYGAGPLGNLYREVSNQQATDALETAWNAGMRYFDTAPFYGLGLSETRVGAFLSSKNKNDYVVSTKVGRLLHPAEPASKRYGFINPLPNDITYDYSYDGVMRSVEASLERLGIDRIDIILMHDIGRLTHGNNHDKHFSVAMESGYRAMDELRSSGVVKAIGLGVNEIEVCMASMDHGYWDCFLLAGRYTLLEQGGIQNFLPRCVEVGSSIILGGAYNSGILATGTRKGGTVYYDYEPAPKEIISRVARIEDICEQYSVDMKAAALQFPMAHPAVSCVIPGMGSPNRIAQTIDLFNAPIPDEFWRNLKADGLLDQDCPIPDMDNTSIQNVGEQTS